jgi:predicted nucleotidyltransferase component of viral defense system
MISRGTILEWQNTAPWQTDEQIEQDLLISRILTEIYQSEFLKERLLFRGGTALHKLYFPEPLRYSEDLDFVQIKSEPAGPIADAIREIIEPWLGPAQTDARRDSFKMYFRFNPETRQDSEIKIKLEWNTREHFSLYGIENIPFGVSTKWYEGDCSIQTYALDELAGTKLRALYQRKKGRDLFDIAELMDRKLINLERTINAYHKYLEFGGTNISKKEFILNLEGKLLDSTFLRDMDALKQAKIDYDPRKAAESISPLINLM